MFEPTRDDAIVQRGIDEALACRDMLTPAPSQPTLAARLAGRFTVALRLLKHLAGDTADDSQWARPAIARFWR